MINDFLVKILTFWIKVYRYLISPLAGPSCRFHPTCSSYALQALKTYGFWKGGVLSLKRILRCNPFGSFGFDPVPEKKKLKQGE